MVRINLISYNNDSQPNPLNFQNIGDLVQPVDGTRMFIRFFSIPNSQTPLVKWNNTRYTLTLSYKSFEVTQNVVLTDLGGGLFVWELSQICDSVNKTLASLVDALDTLSSHTLPTTTYPYIFYDNSESVYNFIAPTVGYAESITPMSDRITIYMNDASFGVFQTIDSHWYPTASPDKRIRAIFYDDFEHTYNTSYLKNTQQSNSLSNYAYMRTLIVTTPMPVDSEILGSTTINSNQSASNIVSSYIVNFDNGAKDTLTNNDFVCPVDPYREVKINAKSLYSVKCNCYFVSIEGDISPFMQPPFSCAIMNIEIN